MTRLGAFQLPFARDGQPQLVAMAGIFAIRLAANSVGMQVAVGKDDAAAEKLLAVCGVVAGKGVQVVPRQRIFADALGNGGVVSFLDRARRGHADAGVLAQRAADGDGLAAGQANIAVRIVVGDLHIAGNDEVVVLHIHAAAISRDGTAVHMKQIAIIAGAATHIHAGTVSADAAAIHNESANVVYVHAGTLRAAGDYSVILFAAIAVAQRQRPAFPDIDYITFCTAFQLNAVPVQTEYDCHCFAVNEFDAPSVFKRYVPRQVVVAGRCRQGAGFRPRRKGDHTVLFCVADPGALVLAAFVLSVAAVVLMGQAVVEVHVDAVVVSARLHLDAEFAALIGGEIVRLAAVRRAGCDGDKLARIYIILMAVSHADPGFRIQALLADGDLVERQIDIILGVAGNVHIAGNGEGSVAAYIYSAAVAGPVVGNAAAGHGEGTAGLGGEVAAHIHAAAIRLIAVVGCILGNTAAVHIKRGGAFVFGVEIHTASVSGGSVAGDAAVVHVKGASGADVHTAAIGTAIIPGNAAAIHGEGGTGGHMHAAASVRRAICTFAMCDRTCMARCTVAEGEFSAAAYENGGRIGVDRKGVTIEVKIHFCVFGSLNGTAQFEIACQIIIASRQHTVQQSLTIYRQLAVTVLRQRLPHYIRVYPVVAARLAADGVRAVSRRDHGERTLAAVIYQTVFAAVAGEALLGRCADALGNRLPLSRRGHADGRTGGQATGIDGGHPGFTASGVLSQIDIVGRAFHGRAAERIALVIIRDLRRAGDIERRVGGTAHIHTAAAGTGFIPSDRAAGHVEGAAAELIRIVLSK